MRTDSSYYPVVSSTPKITISDRSSTKELSYRLPNWEFIYTNSTYQVWFYSSSLNPKPAPLCTFESKGEFEEFLTGLLGFKDEILKVLKPSPPLARNAEV